MRIHLLLLIIVCLMIGGCPSQVEMVSESGNIIVIRPEPNEVVSSPVRIAGQARVFEGNVNLRLRGEDGRELASGFATATQAGPAFGDFESELSFDRPEGISRGTVEVFSISADTNEEMDMVRIPVRLR